jgi:hypothetical protein
MYLPCFTGDRPRQWLRWLPWAEYIYNTAYQSVLRDTPFRVVYGRDPPSIRSYEPDETRVAAVAHPQADGQMESANKVITMYLCYFTGDRPRQWLRWLPWAEYIYNNTY